MSDKKKVFSGVQPSGNLHIGNYLGAVKNWVDSQDEFDNIFCVVDLHAITVKQDPKILREKIREVAAIYLASGIDLEKSIVYVQSHVPAHSQLAWVLNCFIPMGWMERMTQFKEKSGEKRERVSVGLFDYPALMAADILLYNTDVVPVGEDQIQHVELARDVAKRFNSIFEKDVFKIPEVKIKKETARVMGLQNPEKKMSKSSEMESDRIGILDNADVIRKKIMKAETDSENKVAFDKERLGIYNLLSIYQSFTGENKEDIEAKFDGKGYGDFKKDLAEVVVEGLRPIQEKYNEITSHPDYLESVFEKGVEKLRPLVEKKMKEVGDIVGLG